MIKLHLGCGNRHIPEYINIDIRETEATDEVIDIFEALEKYKNVDVIYMCHVLEHFTKKASINILNACYNSLNNTGILRLSVPDFEEVANYWRINNVTNVDIFSGLLLGGHKNEYDYHMQLFNYDKLADMLYDANFERIRFWDWRKVEHANIDDYSQAYLPHMDKENGTLMSLNLEASKTTENYN